LAWNCRRATGSSAAWDYLLEIEPDVALLQEVGAPPTRVTDRFACAVQPASGQAGRPQRFSTAVLVRGEIGAEISLSGSDPWVTAELRFLAGNLVAFEVRPDGWPALKVISVHNPAWPIDRTRLDGLDISSVRLTRQKR